MKMNLFPYKLRDWIDETELNLWNMCANTHPAALHYIEDLIKDPQKELDWVDWGLISANPICIHLIEKHLEKACWSGISMNEAAIHLIKQNPDKIDLELMCHNTNPEAIEILKKNRNKINWGYLAQNPAAIDIVLEHINSATDPDREISTNFWMDLFRNPAAIPFIKRNPWLKQKCIYTCSLCHNPKIMELIDDFPLDEKYIDWSSLSSNPGAIELFEISRSDSVVKSKFHEIEKGKIEKKSEIPPEIQAGSFGLGGSGEISAPRDRAEISPDYMWLSMNPAIFVYDYAAMKEKRANLNEDIVKAALHPRRIARYLDMGFDIADL